ncbi:MAG: Holliday junction branch migration protein RuvA [Pseudomonadales bacterium]|jgi:Holliday junction DNA helicase RuvA|nr:Holliday junction branch migration protein RuvA [Pseudomonadales bacterium]
MIGQIHGILLEKQAPHLLVDVQGVGYEIQAPMTTFYAIPEVGSEVTLHTHFVVREDAQLLFGFHSQPERQMFRSLIKVNGVGPKVGLAILSGIDAAAFAACIAHDDVKTLIKIPGIGKKTAERLLVEMRDRIQEWEISDPTASLLQPITSSTPSDRQQKQEAESALISLGYSVKEADKAVNAIAKEGMNSEQLIRLALKGMVAG